MDIKQAIKIASITSASGMVMTACSDGGSELTAAIDAAQFVSLSIEVNSRNTTVGAGTFEELRAIATLTDDSTQDVSDRVNWSVDDDTLATIAAPDDNSALARLTLLDQAGDVQVQASFSFANLNDTLSLPVSTAELQSITVFVGDDSSATVDIHECAGPYQLNATGDYGNSDTRSITHLINNNGAAWTASESSFVTLDDDAGSFTAKSISISDDGGGDKSVDLTAELAPFSGVGTVQGTLQISVLDDLDSIVVNGSTSIEEGSSASYTATGTYTGASEGLTLVDGISWSEGDSSSNVLSLTSAATEPTATFSAGERGAESISVACGDVSTTTTITVTGIIEAIRVLYLGEDTGTFDLDDDPIQLNAFNFYEGESSVSDDPYERELNWSIEPNNGGATISQDGELRFSQSGVYEVTVDAPDDDLEATFTATVN